MAYPRRRENTFYGGLGLCWPASFFHADAPRALLQVDPTKGEAAVDEEDAGWFESGLDGGAGEDAGLGMAAVEGTDADGDGEVEGRFTFSKGKGFGGGLAEGEDAGSDLLR